MPEDCKHGMNPDWCAICRRAEPVSGPRVGQYGFHGGVTKQQVLDALCDALAIPRQPVGTGSSLPSQVFVEAARRVGVKQGSMPEVGQAIVEKSGGRWRPDYDSRGSLSGGGSTVTLEGLQAMLDAVRRLGA